MGLFWKRVKGNGTGSTGADATDVDQAAQRIAFRLLTAQRHLADRVNIYLRKVKVPFLLAVMVSFGTAFGIYCLYLVLSVFF